MTNKISAIDDLRNNLNRMEPEFKKVLPQSISPDKFVRIAVTAIQNNPKLMECDRKSLFRACMLAAQDNLLPDNREGCIIPFKDKAQWLPMVGGLVKRARQSGEIKTIDAQVVYSNDDYSSWNDEKGPHFSHRKNHADRGFPIVTYAYAITIDGFYFEEIDEKQMAAIEACSRVKEGPWKSEFKDEMRRKSALKRLCKYRLPSSSDIEQVFSREEEAMAEIEPAAELLEPPSTSSRLSRLISEQENVDKTFKETVVESLE